MQTPAHRMLWIDADRVLYAGLLGAPTLRSLGAHVSYLALEASIELAVGGGPWQQLQVAVVAPYTQHRVRCEARRVGVILVEPETVMTDKLPDWLRGEGSDADAQAYLDRVRGVCKRFSLEPAAQPPLVDFDSAVFGQTLATRTLDPRIQQVLDAIKRDPCGHTSAEDYAKSVQLSFSRFLHLFKAEVGVPLRRFRSWRRARQLLHHATSGASLVEIALDTGYPDSTHFSHSIRQAFGLTPRDILAGSRKLAVHGHDGRRG